MLKIAPTAPCPLHDTAATRALEARAAAELAPHALMRRAGLAVARLALALAPHATHIWIACGPGNNGGDGLEAAMHLHQWGKPVTVTWLGSEATAPPDALASWHRAVLAGVVFSNAPPAQPDLCIDALLGIGAARAPGGVMADWLGTMAAGRAPVLAVDLPSGLNADTGEDLAQALRAGPAPRFTLSLLTLKPGLFTHQGRDACGEVWFDALGCAAQRAQQPPSAWRSGPPAPLARPHSSHKGSHGDLLVLGGASGMAGAALLAADAALHGGAGRVFVCLLDAAAPTLDLQRPALMLRPWDGMDATNMAVVCGCGGGEAVRAVLPRVLVTARALVLDADALNAIATDPALALALQDRAGRGQPTVLTPHPLEAARLLGSSAAQVQADRLTAAQALAQRFACVVVLKGSGTVLASPGQTPSINPTGNARLASAGTGDVLAGLIGALLAQGLAAPQAASAGVWWHGAVADQWPPDRTLTADALARALRT